MKREREREICTCIYIYIYIERERERPTHTHTHTPRLRSPRKLPEVSGDVRRLLSERNKFPAGNMDSW